MVGVEDALCSWLLSHLSRQGRRCRGFPRAARVTPSILVVEYGRFKHLLFTHCGLISVIHILSGLSHLPAYISVGSRALPPAHGPPRQRASRHGDHGTVVTVDSCCEMPLL